MQLGANRPIWQLGTMSHMSDFATNRELGVGVEWRTWKLSLCVLRLSP
jgi:hypothetical protein